MKLRQLALLGAIAATLLLPGRAAAQDAKIGVLDGERVFKEYKLYQKLADELQAMGRQMLAEFDERKRRHPLLLEDEWNQLKALRDKGQQMTPAERQQYDRFNALSEERDRKLAELEGQQKLTDQQQAEWRELVAIRAQATQMLQDQWEKIQKQGADRGREIEAQLTKEIKAAVEKVAAAQGLGIVLQSDVVVFGGTDITDATLEILNSTETVAPAGTQ